MDAERGIAIMARDSLSRYFRRLGYVGSSEAGTEFRLLALLWALEVMGGGFRWYTTDEDQAAIRRLVAAVSGDCVIPYTAQCVDGMTLGDPTAVRDLAPRVTEWWQERGTEDMERFRVTEVGTGTSASHGYGKVRKTEDKDAAVRFTEDDNVRGTEHGDI